MASRASRKDSHTQRKGSCHDPSGCILHFVWCSDHIKISVYGDRDLLVPTPEPDNHEPVLQAQ